MPDSRLPAQPPEIAFKVESRFLRTRSAASCGCTAGDAPGAQAAMNAALATLQASCDSASASVGQQPLGPYGSSGSCSFDCGFKEQKWSWSWDCRFTNTNLAASVASMNFTAPYRQAFAATAGWVGTGLPEYGTSISAALAAIGAIDAAIIQAGGDETPQQQAQLANGFATLATMAQDNLAQANQGLGNLASFLSWWESGQTSSLQSYVASSKSYIITTATNTENSLIGDIACGDGDVSASFNAMFADVNTKYAAMQPGFDAVTGNANAALKAGDAVAGVFLIIQSDNTLFTQQVAKAKALAPTDIMRRLALQLATQDWNNLVQEADTQLLPAP